MARLWLSMIHQLNSLRAASSRRLTTVEGQRRPVLVSPFSLLIRWTLGLNFCLALLLCTATASGHMRSTPDSDSATSIGLTRCGAVPCFKGAIPDRTTWANAKTTFTLVRNTKLFEHQVYVHLGSDGGAAVYPSLDGLSVGQIYILIPTNLP